MSYTEAFLNYLNALPDGLIYVTLGLSAFVENVFPPIPGDTVTAFGAFLVGMGRLNFMGVYAATTIGSLIGFLTLFELGRYLGRRFFIEKDYRFFKAEDILKAETWFRKYGYFLIAMNRFFPGIRSVIALSGGMLKLEVKWVTLLAFVSCGVWNLMWILMGYLLGSHWEAVQTRMSQIMLRYNILVLLLILMVVLYVLIRKRVKK